jgi:hypothetical protein
MIAACPLCSESVMVYFNEKTLSDALVSVWHYSRPDNHHWKLDKEASAILRDEFATEQERSKLRKKRGRRS